MKDNYPQRELTVAEKLIRAKAYGDGYRKGYEIGCASHSDATTNTYTKSTRLVVSPSVDDVLDKFKEVIRLHDEDELLYPDLYNEFLVIYKSLRKEATK